MMNIDDITLDHRVSSIAPCFTGVIASTSYGTPAFKVNKRFSSRFKEDGRTLVIYRGAGESDERKPGHIFLLPAIIKIISG